MYGLGRSVVYGLRAGGGREERRDKRRMWHVENIEGVGWQRPVVVRVVWL